MSGEQQPLNIDPIEVITKRVLPDGTVEVLMKVSERDRKRLLDDPHARYSIAGHYPLVKVPGADLPSCKTQREQFYEELHAAMAKRSMVQVTPTVAPTYVTAHLTLPMLERAKAAMDDPERFRREREGTWPPRERCRAHVDCVLVEGHPGGCAWPYVEEVDRG
jgi:hypothetical protein